ncbi:hypothetical protein [Paraburkholderia mimosarum]|uniref:hypothetical protein n=1 Tax=Paraburkholderia mimosarum TaxID=312026 RepID=UPI0012B5F515|nr:hypothetical protein [Paraburkholderia mimosarum]
MFRIKAIQAEHGDALLVSYGDPERPRHVLVDGGPAGTRDTLLALLKKECIDCPRRLNFEPPRRPNFEPG